MTSYILRRFVNYAILTALATVFVYIAASTFFYPRRRYLGRNPPIPEDSIDSILTGYGINDKDPVLLRTWWWIERIVTDPLPDKLGHDLGNNAVISEIFSRAGVSLRLLLAGAIIAAILGVILGVWGAVRQQYEWGRADPRLYREFRAAGCPRRAWPRMAASAAKVAATAPKLVAGEAARGEWLRRTALLAGRVTGSARLRCLYV